MRIHKIVQGNISTTIPNTNLRSVDSYLTYKIVRFAPMIWVLCLMTSISASDINISTLASPNNGGTIIGTPNAGNWAASQFQVGPDSPLSSINQIILALEPSGSGTTNLSLLSVSIYSDLAGLPGVELTPGSGEFVNPGTLSVPGNVTFSRLIPFTLQSNTTYWVVLESTAGSTLADSARWSYSEDPGSLSVMGTNGQINSVTASSFNSGGTWNPNTNQFYRFAIHAPEPSTYVLGSVATGVMAFAARRRNRQVSIKA